MILKSNKTFSDQNSTILNQNLNRTVQTTSIVWLYFLNRTALAHPAEKHFAAIKISFLFSTVRLKVWLYGRNFQPYDWCWHHFVFPNAQNAMITPGYSEKPAESFRRDQLGSNRGHTSPLSNLIPSCWFFYKLRWRPVEIFNVEVLCSNPALVSLSLQNQTTKNSKKLSKILPKNSFGNTSKSSKTHKNISNTSQSQGEISRLALPCSTPSREALVQIVFPHPKVKINLPSPKYCAMTLNIAWYGRGIHPKIISDSILLCFLQNIW